MEEQESIAQLQQEVAEMQQTLQQQYDQLLQLQRRLSALQGQPLPAPTQAGQGRHSLENFIGLRLIHLVGIVVLLIGVSIGVKYAFDRNLISEEARIGLAYGAGVALLLVAYRLRRAYERFSAILFSGALATLYFTSYAAHVYYALLPFAAVFGLMVLLTIFAALEAVRYNRMEIALLGLVGAYAIPFLISSNAERADLLFLYILIINLGVLYLRVKKGWPTVGWVAQLLTWVLFIGWSSTRFVPAQVVQASLFLAVYFILFTLMALGSGFVTNRPATTGESQQQLLNNTSIYVAALFLFAPGGQDAVLGAVSLACMAGAVAQAFIFQQYVKGSTYISRLHYGWGVVLAAVAIAFYFDGLAVSLSWLLMAVGLFALGVVLKDTLWRMAALSLMALTLMKLLLIDSQRFTAGQKVVVYISLGLLLLVVGFFYQKFRQKWFDGK